MLVGERGLTHVSRLGVLQVTQFVMEGAQGNAPAAAKHKHPYRCTYAVGGRRPAVSHPTPPAIESPVMCQPRASNRSAE